MVAKTERLDAETCHAKAAECRALAKSARKESDETMLLHMAETWERIAKTYDGDHGNWTAPKTKQ